MVGLTVLIGCMGQHRLIRAAEVSAQPAPIASQTTLPPVRRRERRGEKTTPRGH
jgi:hypothetical protein